jgi:hypothetical protein
MGYKKYHRKYPEQRWDYKAIETRVGGIRVIYYELRNKGKMTKGVETYSGKNYDIHSNAPSHSRHYPISKIPKKYKDVITDLKEKHKKTKWSKKKRVDLN